MFVSLDLETRLIDAGRLDPDVVCMSVCDDQFEPELFSHLESEPVVEALLRDPDVVIVGANIAYDFGCLLREYPSLRNLIFQAYRDSRVLDCQLAQRLIDIANGELDGTFNHRGDYVKHYYSLAALHERWGLGALAKEGTWRLRYGELRGLKVSEYPEDARKYALDDAAATLRVFLHQNEAYPHFLKDLAAQSRAAFALHLSAVRGIVTDAQACAQYLTEVKDEIESYKKLLEEHKILRPNGSKDTKVAKAYMELACVRAGIQPKLTDTGGICMDAEACRDVNDPVMKAYAAFTSAKTTLARVEKLQLGSTGVPLQTRFTSLVNNGRSASSEPSPPMVGANLQNLPRGGKARQVFVPRPGFVFCSVDFTGAELHTFAQVEKWITGKSKIGDALNEKKDLHCYLAAALLECSYEEAYENRKVGKYKWARGVSKNANFGLAGGMGAKLFAAMTNKNAKKAEDRITEDFAQKLRDLWYEVWDTQPYFDFVNGLFASSGLATVEHFVSGRVRGKVDFKVAANGFFSGLTADAFKAAYFNLTEECHTREDSVLFGSRPILPIHDEIISELVDGPNLAAAAARKTELMVNTYNLYTPDYPVRAEPALMRVWFKAADPAYDADGNLRCWNPRLDDKEFDEKNYLKRALELCASP